MLTILYYYCEGGIVMISANNNFGNNVGNAQQSEKRNWKIGGHGTAVDERRKRRFIC